MPGNYSQYIERMTKSFDRTTKSLIPYYAVQLTAGNPHPRILDVGFGSGVVGSALRALLLDAVICGIDMAPQNIENAPKGIYDELYCCRLEDFYLPNQQDGFDLAIFSSVLHEISSYAEEDRFSVKHIKNALQKTRDLLKDGGYVLIRDGLKSPCEDLVSIELAAQKDLNALKRFCRERPMNPWEEDERKQQLALAEAADALHLSFPNNAFREFLCTWTWGPESWDREVQERFCTMTLAEWIRSLEETGFECAANIASLEEYPKYFSRICRYQLEDPIIGVLAGKKR